LHIPQRIEATQRAPTMSDLLDGLALVT